MTPYQAPLADMRFVLEELHGSGDIAKLPGYEEATPDLIAKVSLLGTDLHAYSLKTVKMFHDDARAAGFKLV